VSESFKCPKCGGPYFGTSGYLKSDTSDNWTAHCHTYNQATGIQCNWSGPYNEAVKIHCTCLGSQGGPDYCPVHAA